MSPTPPNGHGMGSSRFGRDGFGDPRPESGEESFVRCPEVFLEGLTPEQWKAQQQLYQVAYEKAKEKAGKSSWLYEPPFNLGTGI
jgi:hypothetical protein